MLRCAARDGDDESAASCSPRTRSPHTCVPLSSAKSLCPAKSLAARRRHCARHRGRCQGDHRQPQEPQRLRHPPHLVRRPALACSRPAPPCALPHVLPAWLQASALHLHGQRRSRGSSFPRRFGIKYDTVPYCGLVRELHADGHEIALHTRDHVRLDMPIDAAKKGARKCGEGSAPGPRGERLARSRGSSSGSAPTKHASPSPARPPARRANP